MTLYPDVQKKVQAEIDVVVGPNRLPDFHDRPSLPCINAVIKELSRWNLVLPFGRDFYMIIITLLTSFEGIPICLLSMMNIMDSIFRKEQL